MVMGIVMLVMVCGALACGDEEHYPPGNGSGPTGGGSGGGDGTDDPVGEVAVAEVCPDFAQARCAGALACDLDSLVRVPADVTPCWTEVALFCFERRTESVPSDDLAACTDAIAMQECTADLPVPDACGDLWDTVPPDAGTLDAGTPDAGTPDAGTPDAAP